MYKIKVMYYKQTIQVGKCPPQESNGGVAVNILTAICRYGSSIIWKRLHVNK